MGPNGVAGEWGHNPLPWPRPDWNEVPGPLGWDGRHGAIEDWYGELFALGHAHSVECWRGGELAGGLYGVSIGAAFFPAAGREVEHHVIVQVQCLA